MGRTRRWTCSPMDEGHSGLLTVTLLCQALRAAKVGTNRLYQTVVAELPMLDTALPAACGTV